MNKLLTIAAVVAFTTGAYATDLPSKKAAPAAATTASADTTITTGYGMEFTPDKYSASTASTYAVSADRNIGSGISVGVAAGTSQAASQGALKQTLEATAGYKMPLFADLTAKVGGSVGERFTNGANYPFYTLSAGSDYKLADNLTLNAVGYRYRNAFDSAAYDFESHQLSTGATFAINKTNAVFVKLARSYDGDFKASTDAVTFGYKFSF